MISEIKTVSPEQLELPVTFRANGYISYDMQNVYSISSRYEGRIEKLYIKYNFQKIEKGQVIFEIYSPELVTAQQDFIFILKNDKDNQTLIDAAKKKLELMGMVENQIAQVAALKLVQYKMPVYSQVSGYIIEESQGRKMATRADKEMGGQSTLPSNPGNKDLLTKEGQYLEKGSTVFKVISNKTVWAELKLFNAGLNVIRKGNDVTVYVDGSTHSIVSTVDQILPIFTESEAYLTARVILENKGGEIKIGALVKSEIVSRQKSALWLKKEAIIDLGIEKVVFQVTSKNLLKVKRIHIGQVSADMVEIREGLNKDDRVAANAEFLMDSESFIKQ
ncbi:MAG: efflux RND transporter periplasmic adaptor subunit [bacterium]|nr:efflux RND transporter periplasmic adaptor subunit [bacterium]